MRGGMITLGARTDFSFMRGFGTPKQWRTQCEKLGIEALAVTDYCSTWGHAEFQQEFKGSSTRVLYGVQLPVVVLLNKTQEHDIVTLIARTTTGLRYLYEAVSKADAQTYYRPRLTWQQIEALSKHCWVIVNDVSFARLKSLQRVKGLMVGARPTRDPTLHLVKSGEFPVVPMLVPSYPATGDAQAFQLMQAISAGQRISEVEGAAWPLTSRADYEGAMAAVRVEPAEDWFARAADIVEQTDADIPSATKIKISKTQKAAQKELWKRCVAGAKSLGVDLERPDYARRIDRELEVIAEKKFEDYFIFVADLVTWAKERMFVGPGRGSSGGSLLCYLMGITTIDPLKYGTLFERFIDITRPDWPDIDVDFPDNLRDLVYTYLKERFGHDHVARLGTVSEFGAKGAINDTAKATGVSLDVARACGRILDGHVISGQLRGGSLADLLHSDPALAEIVEKNPSLAKAGDIFEHARHHGVHAAGVVVTNEPSASFGSVDRQGTIWLDMKMAEKIGMIKMDVLGLRTLSVIQDCCDQVGIDPRSLYKLDFQGGDQKVFDLFNNDRVTGVFQFEGSAVRNLMKQIKVDCFEDLAALTSLARPGPLAGGGAELWCQRRGGEIEWEHKHPSLAKHLESTFGAIVYQEQAMAIVRDLGGFDEPSVNGFRRAVGKKERDKLLAYRDQFLTGCESWADREGEGAISSDVANDLWEEMCEFGSYAFNLAHAVAYAMISYMAAYLKAHHALEFAVANLRNAADEDQAKALLRELIEEGYEVTTFDPARSGASWTVVEGKLLGGFDSVRGVGKKSATEFLALREVDPEHWLERLTPSQRSRLTSAENTPWDSLTYFSRTYADLYADPDGYRSPALKAGVTPPVYRIKDIPKEPGVYRFLGKVKSRWLKESTGTWNFKFEDDTGEYGVSIGKRFQPKFQWLIEGGVEGRDFLIKGTRKRIDWMFAEAIIELNGEQNGEEG